jgi:hypothetical protein
LLRGIILALSIVGVPATASASLFHRPLILPRGDWAVGLGLGVSRFDAPSPTPDTYGFGFNLELRASPNEGVQIGVRTGIRTGSDGQKYRADQYGRAFDTETFATGTDPVANPEASLQFAALDRPRLSLSVQVRLYLPVEKDTELGALLGAPLQIRLTRSLCIDTAAYFLIVDTNPIATAVIAPVQLWLERGPLAVGLLSGVRRYNRPQHTEILVGLGVNLAATVNFDVRLWALMPNVNGRAARRNMGAGVGVERRF